LAVSKEATQKFDGERFNLRKLNEPNVRQQYQIEITNRFVALENLSDNEDINGVWENINLSATGLNFTCHLIILTLRLLMSYIYIYIYDISSLRVKGKVKIPAKESLGLHELKQHKP